MKKITGFLVLMTTAYPSLAAAQIRDVQSFGGALITFLNKTLMPFLFSLALLVFIYYVIRYFIINPDNERDRASAKRYALYSIGGFVLMASVWGVVNLIVAGTGLGQADPVCPDAVPSAFCRGVGSNSTFNPRPTATIPGSNTSFGEGGSGRTQYWEDYYAGGSFGEGGSAAPSQNTPTNQTPPSTSQAARIKAAENVYATAALDYTLEMANGLQSAVDAGEIPAETAQDLMEIASETLLVPDSDDQAKMDLLDIYKDYVSPETHQEATQTLNAWRQTQGSHVLFPSTL